MNEEGLCHVGLDYIFHIVGPEDHIRTLQFLALARPPGH